MEPQMKQQDKKPQGSEKRNKTSKQTNSNKSPSKEGKTGKIAQFVQNSLTEITIQIKGNQYQKFILNTISGTQSVVKDIFKQKIFTITDIIQSQGIQSQMNKRIVSILFSGQCKQQPQEVDIWFKNQIGVEQRKMKYMQIVHILVKYIQIKNETVQGEWDLTFQAQNNKMELELDQLFRKQNLQNQIGKWFLPNYLEIQQKQNQPTNIQNDTHRYLFQMKSKPFQLPNGQNRNKHIQNIKTWANQNQNIKVQVQQCLNLIYNKRNEQAIEQLKSKGEFRKKFLARLIDDNMLHNVTQIIKQLIAAINQYYKQQRQKLKFEDYLRARGESQDITLKVKHPRIVFYYVLNSNISKQKFREVFDFFKPLIKSFFVYFHAVLHVVGLTQSEQERKQRVELEQNSKMELLMRKIQKMEEQNNEKMKKSQEQNNEKMKKLQEQNNEKMKKLQEELNNKLLNQEQNRKKLQQQQLQRKKKLQKQQQQRIKRFQKMMCDSFSQIIDLIKGAKNESGSSINV